jgi:transposase
MPLRASVCLIVACLLHLLHLLHPPLNLLFIAMVYHRIDTNTKSKAVALLQSHWRPDAIATKSHCHLSTAYRWEKRLQTFGAPNPPGRLRTGRHRKITTAARNSLLEYQRRHPWAFQDELALFLEEEWEVTVDKSTICRLLKREGISKKKGELIGPQSQPLRTQWQAQMQNVTADQLVFCDESIFKDQSCWRLTGYGSIGEATRWSQDMTRGITYSILPAYTIDGYLPCTGIKKGFYNNEEFYDWVNEDLLPLCSPFPGPRSIICLDNLSIHINDRIRELVESHGCLLWFLPPYSPDYNPIELTFSVLKAWMRRHFPRLRSTFADFGTFLIYAVEHSQCDRFAVEHFKHSAGGYVFEGDIAAFERELWEWSNDEY